MMYREVRTLRGHSGPLSVVTFNSEGRYALTGGSDKSVCLWNPFRGDGDTASLVKRYDPGSRGIAALAVAADSSKFACGGGDRGVAVLDVTSGNILRKLFGHEQRVSAVAFNADASVVVSGSFDKAVRVFDLRAQSRTAMQVLGGAKDSITTVAVTADEILASSLDGCIRTYDLRLGRCTTVDVASSIAAMCLSRDKQSVLAALPAEGGTLLLLDRAGSAVLNKYQGHTHTEYALQPCLTADDAYAVCGSEDGRVCVWDVLEGGLVAQWPAHARAVACVAAHPAPTSRTIITASFDGTAKVWEPVGAAPAAAAAAPTAAT